MFNNSWVILKFHFANQIRRSKESVVHAVLINSKILFLISCCCISNHIVSMEI